MHRGNSVPLCARCDSHGGVVAQVERANNRIEYLLERRVKTMDALLHEWKSDLLRIWIPMVAGACMLIGLFGGMEILGCRDAPVVTQPTTAAEPTIPPAAPQDPAKIPRHARRHRYIRNCLRSPFNRCIARSIQPRPNVQGARVAMECETSGITERVQSTSVQEHVILRIPAPALLMAISGRATVRGLSDDFAPASQETIPIRFVRLVVDRCKHDA